MRAGDIRADAFQEMLMADLVVVDLTLDDPNIWYELGVRHALRARGVLLVQGPRVNQPFDIYTDRKRRYSLKDGAPDSASLEADKDAIANLARETLAAPTSRRTSPVYALLSHLQEPPWRDLLLSQSNEFSDQYEARQSRMEVARQRRRPGDLLVLSDETPTLALRFEAKRLAGISLLALGQYTLALEQFESALRIDPQDSACRQRHVVCLSRLGRFEEAEERVRGLTQDHPSDPEVWALAGRVAKDRWLARWRSPGADAPQLREEAAAELASLDEAIDAYASAFTADPSHFYSGINALTLQLLRSHLGGPRDTQMLDRLIGGAAWAVASAQQRNPRDYWARISAAELCLLTGTAADVRRAYASAVAAADRDRFALDSARQTLVLLAELDFKPEETAVATGVIDKEIGRLVTPFVPRQVLLFSGHIVDAPDRATPRFPPSKVADAAREIGNTLDKLGARAGDFALCQAAAGGDLLFLEACQQRGVEPLILLPFDEPEFIERSIMRASDAEAWRQRFHAMKAAAPAPAIRTMPEELGPCPKGVDPYERCNLWLLYTALAYGENKVRFVCLWNGAGGDGPGGTRHMYDEVRRRGGQVAWIDTRTL
jgi:tetratricopeptide (TPR) repeat protein